MKIAAFFIVILGLIIADGTAQPQTGIPLSSAKANGCAYLFSSCNHFYNNYKASPQNEKAEKMKCVADMLLQIVQMFAIHINVSVPDFLLSMNISPAAVNAYKTGDMNGFYASISIDGLYSNIHICLDMVFALNGEVFDNVLTSVNQDLGVFQDDSRNRTITSPTEIIVKYKNKPVYAVLNRLLTVVDGAVNTLTGTVGIVPDLGGNTAENLVGTVGSAHQ
ncbi:uncharacterized protein LOC134935488 [Pseudophryne corroboree]|uniref:uncharacterized protein LOC134935488 n=1 Tax=Pseudophryne corroboree TaxID=495146 RepID=UPI003081293E